MRHLSRMEESNSLPRFGSTASDAVELAVLADVSRFLPCVVCFWWGTDISEGERKWSCQEALLHRVELYMTEPRLQKKGV